MSLLDEMIGYEGHEPPHTPKNCQRWIPVGERLPEIDRDVLLTDGEEVVQAWLDEDDGWQVWHTSQNWRGARAWMPLPEPPEVK
jgi:hypothetical protein